MHPSHPPDDQDTQDSPSTLLTWIRAWRSAIRNPDKTIPHPEIPPEGIPLPAELELHCPECGYNLTGLTKWRCPECGKPFNPFRAHTLRLLKQPEYILRYRVDARAIRCVFWIVIILAGTVPAVWLIGQGIAAGPNASSHYARGQCVKLALLPLIAVAAWMVREEASMRSFLVLVITLFITTWTMAWLLR